MGIPCLTFEEIMSKRLDDLELAILKSLCEEPEKGLKSSDLQKNVDIDKVTFYKRLQRLTDELRIVERLTYTSTGVKDRREVYYRVRPECQAICSELVSGFEIRQFLAGTSFQSLDPKEPGCGRMVPIDSTSGATMVVFSNRKVDPSFLCSKLEDKNFNEDLPRVLGDVFKSLIKGLSGPAGTNDQTRIAVVLTYPMEEDK